MAGSRKPFHPGTKARPRDGGLPSAATLHSRTRSVLVSLFVSLRRPLHMLKRSLILLAVLAGVPPAQAGQRLQAKLDSPFRARTHESGTSRVIIETADVSGTDRPDSLAKRQAGPALGLLLEDRWPKFLMRPSNRWRDSRASVPSAWTVPSAERWSGRRPHRGAVGPRESRLRRRRRRRGDHRLRRHVVARRSRQRSRRAFRRFRRISAVGVRRLRPRHARRAESSPAAGTIRTARGAGWRR